MNKKSFILLHIALLIYAATNVFAKMASFESGLTFNYILFVGLQLMCLGIYAVLWQFVLKDMSLTVAYANKGIVIIYGALIGLLLFNESISIKNVVGMLVIIAGIIIMAKGETNE